MKEFIAKPGRPSPLPMTMDGFEFRSSSDTSFGVKEIYESHVICM